MLDQVTDTRMVKRLDGKCVPQPEPLVSQYIKSSTFRDTDLLHLVKHHHLLSIASYKSLSKKFSTRWNSPKRYLYFFQFWHILIYAASAQKTLTICHLDSRILHFTPNLANRKRKTHKQVSRGKEEIMSPDKICGICEKKLKEESWVDTNVSCRTCDGLGRVPCERKHTNLNKIVCREYMYYS